MKFLTHALTQALWAGLGMSLSSAVMGCFLLWRRLAFFGDAMAHAAVLGAALALLWGGGFSFFILVVCLAIAWVMGRVDSKGGPPPEIWMAGLSYLALSLGLILGHEGVESFLFGDLLALTRTDIQWIFSVGGFTIVGLFWKWRSFLALVFDEEWAITRGVPVTPLQFWLIFGMGLGVAVGIKTSGALLFPALMILPAATAALVAQSPPAMIFWSMGFSMGSFTVGLALSYHYDYSPSPMIVLVASLLFLGLGACQKAASFFVLKKS